MEQNTEKIKALAEYIVEECKKQGFIAGTFQPREFICSKLSCFSKSEYER